MQAVEQTAGEIQGVVVLAQEDRFRVDTEDGRSMLFVLGRGSGLSMEEVESWAGKAQKVLVRYRGDPLQGPVVEQVRPV